MATRKRSLGIVLSTLAVSAQSSSHVKPAVIPPPPPPRRGTTSTSPLFSLDRPPPPPPPPREDAKDDATCSINDEEKDILGKNNLEQLGIELEEEKLPNEAETAQPASEVASNPKDSKEGPPTVSVDQELSFSSPISSVEPSISHDSRSSTSRMTVPSADEGSKQSQQVDASTQTHPLQALSIHDGAVPPPPNRPQQRQNTPPQRYERPPAGPHSFRPPHQMQPPLRPRIDTQHYHPQLQPQRSNNFQRPPPNQKYSQQPQRPRQPNPRQAGPPRMQQPSTWKSLWKKIERGLDGLADVEDAVSGRAHQIYANTVQRKRRPDPPPVETMDWSRFHRSQTTKLDTKQQNPPPQKLPAFSHASRPISATKPGVRKQQYRSVNWNDARTGQKQQHRPTAAVANGGASTAPEPQDQQQRPPTTKQSATAAASRIPPQFRQPLQPSTGEARTRRKFPDEDDDEPSLIRRLADAIPRFPKLPFGQSSTGELAASAAMEAWKSEDEDSVQRKKIRWGLPRLFARSQPPPATVSATTKEGGLAAPLEALAERIEYPKQSGLLRPEEVSRCLSIGRSKAFFDVLFLAFLMAGIHQLSLVEEIVTIRGPFWEMVKAAFNRMDSIFVAAIDTWAPMALVCAFLSTRTSLLIGRRNEKSFKAEVEGSVQSQSQYGSLYLRLTSGAVLDREAADKMIRATSSKIEAHVGEARLRAFAACIATPIVVAAFSFLGPIMSELITLFGHFFGSVQNSALRSSVQEALLSFSRNTKMAFVSTFDAALDQPLVFAYKLSFLVAVLVVAGLPQFMIRSSTTPAPPSEDHSELEYDDEMYYKFTEHIHSYGSSGINRLNLASADLQLSLLDRWSSFSPSHRASPLETSLQSALRTGFVSILSLLFLTAPLSFFFLGNGVGLGQATLFVPQWHSFLDVGCVVLLTQYLAWDAIVRSSVSSRFEEKALGFISQLKKAIADKRQKLEKPPVPVGFRGTISPSAGVAVRDLWASHVSKRAWALRGASLTCKNGEVLAIIGEDGSAKSRLLVALVESILDADPGSKSLQVARGSISVGGMDVNKWDTRQLKSRVGLLLEDVNSLGATAHLFSGMSLEEILDPRPNAGIHNVNDGPGEKERNAMVLALKMSGLYTTLMRRLPAKMDTIVTSAEEDLAPSPMRPRQHILSPSEWSKLLFAKVIARVFYDNENPSGSNQNIQNSLIGSVLILDDFTSHLSETEETRMLRDLRDSGAATMFTSNRWAIGRLADRIAVMKDGAVVETGTHTELLLRGAKQSIYAAKWQAMAGGS